MSVRRLQNASRISSSSALNATGRGYIYDADAETYIAAVEAADGERLEWGVRQAMSQFVAGCKTDGIWTAIKSSCILCGARTLSGALTPLAGSAPTNNGPFVSGDYTRGGTTPGLKGNGSTKYLNSNYADNADGQDNAHRAVFVTVQISSPTTSYAQYIGAMGTGGVSPYSHFYNYPVGGNTETYRMRSGSTIQAGSRATGLKGMSRSSSSSFTIRANWRTDTATATSTGTTTNNVYVFASNGDAGNRCDARLAFYSIGSSLDLVALEFRVNALVYSIGSVV